MNIKVIGVGGIGGCLLPPLARYLNYTLRGEAQLTLIDGDYFETRNAERQSFASLGNKANEVAVALFRSFPDLHIDGQACYITEDNAGMLIRENDVVFLCVDNHATRKLVSDRCEELQDILLIFGGNEYTDGNIQVYNRAGGKDLTLPLCNQYHLEISNPRDKSPAHAGCARIVESKPQLLFANNMAAAMMLNAFYAFTQHKLDYDEAYFDCILNSARRVNRRG